MELVRHDLWWLLEEDFRRKPDTLGCFEWAAMLGENAGYHYKKHPTTRAYLNFKTDGKIEVGDGLKKANCDGRLMLLFQTKELVIVFAVTSDGKFVEENSIFIVPRADLSSVQNRPIQRNEKLVDKAKAKRLGACANYASASQQWHNPLSPPSQLQSETNTNR